MKKEYSVGIIGFGMIGKVHAFGYATLPFYWNASDSVGFRITHVATAHSHTAELAKKICKADSACTDFREITENPEVDVVHICTPNDQHFEALLSAIENNKPVYCEKPLCTTSEQSRVVLRAIRESGYASTHQMVFHTRFFPAIMRLKQLLETGRLGRILQFRAGYYHASNASGRFPYKWKHSESGGVIRDLASHVLDLVDHLLGPFESIYAQTQLAFPERPLAQNAGGSENAGFAALEKKAVHVEDAVSMLVRMNSGAQGVLEATKLATGHEDELRLEIHGEKGAARFHLMQPHYLEFFDAELPDQPIGGISGWTRIPCGGRFESPHASFPSPKSTIGWTRAHVACLSNFLSAVIRNEQADPDLYQGAKIQNLMDHVFLSAQNNRIESGLS